MNLTEDTVALVTGASSGIGRALALRLADRGVRVVAVARRQTLIDELAREISDARGTARAVACDVTDREQFERAVAATIEEFGRLDILVNNAGQGHFGYVDDTPAEHVEKIFAVNVFSLWHGTAPTIRHMKERGSGLVVNMASMAGKIGYPANAAYVAAKHAVVGFTRALRAELAETGVEAMVVVPGGAETDWALVTEGGGMLEIFEYEGRRGAEIARERRIEPFPPMPLLTAGDVAERIIAAMEHPVPELYTHDNSRHIADAFQLDQPAAEERMHPFWIANREGYLG